MGEHLKLILIFCLCCVLLQIHFSESKPKKRCHPREEKCERRKRPSSRDKKELLDMIDDLQDKLDDVEELNEYQDDKIHDLELELSSQNDTLNSLLETFDEHLRAVEIYKTELQIYLEQRIKCTDEVDDNEITTELQVNATESPNCSLKGAELVGLMKVGTRVVRGEHWGWDDMDGNPPEEGVVVRETNHNRWILVRFGNSSVIHNVRMGYNSKYDLKLAECRDF